jgi:hypothetical protein
LYRQVGGALGWRAAFWIESLLMLPFAVFGFVSDRIYLKGVEVLIQLHWNWGDMSLVGPLQMSYFHAAAINFF